MFYVNLAFLSGGLPTTEGTIVQNAARKAGLGYEAGIDTSRTFPSRVIKHNGIGGGYDITNLREYARRQAEFLPEGFDLENLTMPFNGDTPWWQGLTNQQRKAAERYRAVWDILRAR